MDAKGLLSQHSDVYIRGLFKEFLGILEDLREEHSANFDKLYNSLPEKYHALVSMADYFDEDKFSWYRKKVLDFGNETLRNHSRNLENFQVSFTFKQ